jgi:hypothetical protein
MIRALAGCVLLVALNVSSAEGEPRCVSTRVSYGDDTSTDLSPAAIDRLIRDLDDDQFSIREAASQKLASAGKKALEPLRKAAVGTSLEVTIRAIAIIATMSTSADRDTAQAAKELLVKLAAGDHAAAAERARRTLFDHILQIANRIGQLGGGVHINEAGLASVNLDNAKDLAAAISLLKGIPNLQDLSLSTKQMDDKLMSQLKNLPKLRHLNLYRSKIGDAGLKHLKNLPGLRSVPMGETQVTDEGLVHLKDLTQLEYVGLRADNITDNGLVHLKNLTNLTGLYLGETKVTDAGLVHLEGMTKMESLRLDHTSVTDSGLVHLKPMTSLRFLDLTQTKVTPAGIGRLKKAIPGLNVTIESR